MSKMATIAAALAIAFGTAVMTGALAGPGGGGGHGGGGGGGHGGGGGGVGGGGGGGVGGGGGGGVGGGGIGAMGIGHGGPVGGPAMGAMSRGSVTGPGPGAVYSPSLAGSRTSPGAVTNAPAFSRTPMVANRGMLNGLAPTGKNYTPGRNLAYNNYRHGDHDHHHDHHHHRFVGGVFAFGGWPYYDYYDYSDTCYQPRRVWTPYGWRWQYVYVCY